MPTACRPRRWNRAGGSDPWVRPRSVARLRRKLDGLDSLLKVLPEAIEIALTKAGRHEEAISHLAFARLCYEEARDQGEVTRARRGAATAKAEAGRLKEAERDLLRMLAVTRHIEKSPTLWGRRAGHEP